MNTHPHLQAPAASWLALAGLVSLVLSCAGAHESAVRRDLETVRQGLSRAAKGSMALDRTGPREGASGGAAPVYGEVLAGSPPPSDEAAATTGPHDLSAYMRYALGSNPAVRAAFARWEASVHRISRARRLPEPVLGFGYFLSSVETRVGPQQARLSLQQTFPWPTKLSAGSDAMAAQARAAQKRFEVQTLRVSQAVADAYWKLWEIRRVRDVHREHLEVIRALSETVRARIATGAAMLADQQQIDLTAAKLADAIAGMDEAERAAEAGLRAAIGLGAGGALATPDNPAEPTVPQQDEQVLAALARKHPLITSFAWMAEAQDSTARAEAADRYPSFSVGGDWIITGEAAMPNVPGSGKDAVVLGAGLRVPLWQGSYADAEAAARVEGEAQRAEQQAAVDRALADLDRFLSAVRDSARRVQLYRHTLLPQADSAYASVLGAYTAGRGTVAQTLLAQRDLLELRVGLLRAGAAHARAWAQLEQTTGQAIPRTTFNPSPKTQGE